MKKTIITLMALAGVAAAETLTLTPAISSLESANKAVWAGENLTSWEISFDLLDKAFKANAPATTDSSAYSNSVSVLFGTSTSSGGAGYLLGVTNTGALTLFTHKNNTTFTYEIFDTVQVVSSTTDKTSVSLSFVADVNAESEVVGGTFTVKAGTESAVYSVTANLGATTLTGCDENGNGGARLWTNGGEEQFSNIKLAQLSNNVVPEPATATLSLLALAGLAARRRRK